ncbi:hypothetical protein DTO027B5_791 [Paecilomyces variotii]|nr:hypothetical protein DTO169C6_423 [Paecilomyces variotii]KAJ9257001.1 hypothetical protein DTO195F2_5680 [Paecilomyces variotii]KAJ9290005.1 hypothetical protein DTO021C3_2363 [Paecilomyces variotii]KAJ9305816.1 hypothetical protein DTO217A2_4729 [Paecilomyces variotii]KAJ9329609.1 hypothetical protein DTO027B3_96 [Paecilomyces variotii]
MQLPPASVMAHWPTPNYIDPPSRGGALLVVNIVFTSLSFLVVCMRIYTRLRITGSVGLDDATIIVSMLFAIAMAVVTSLASARYGWNRHIWDVPLEWIPTSEKLNMMFQVFFSFASTLTKLSLLWFCRRLLGAGIKGAFRSFNLCLIAAMFVVAAMCITFVCMTIFQCNPVRAFWDLEPSYPYHCLNGNNDVFAASVVNIFTDLLCTVLPMPLIWRLKLPVRQRMAVISIFGVGIVVNVAGAIRTAFVYKSLIASYDSTWVGWPIFLAAAIEINLGLICASAPALRPLVAHFVPRLFQSTRNLASSSLGQSGRTQKLWRSTGLSKDSRSRLSSAQQHASSDGPERVEILRTIEMETWTQSRNSQHEMLPASSKALGLPDHDQKHMESRCDVRVGEDEVRSSGSSSPLEFFTHDSPFEDRGPL